MILLVNISGYGSILTLKKHWIQTIPLFGLGPKPKVVKHAADLYHPHFSYSDRRLNRFTERQNITYSPSIIIIIITIIIIRDIDIALSLFIVLLSLAKICFNQRMLAAIIGAKRYSYTQASGPVRMPLMTEWTSRHMTSLHLQRLEPVTLQLWVLRSK